LGFETRLPAVNRVVKQPKFASSDLAAGGGGREEREERWSVSVFFHGFVSFCGGWD